MDSTDAASNPRRSPEDIAELLRERPETRVLDVRTAASRDGSTTIPGSELLDVNADIAAGELAVLLDASLPVDEPIVFVCNSGGKCSLAAAYLRDRGYDAVSIDGGMHAWEAAGNPVVDPGE